MSRFPLEFARWFRFYGKKRRWRRTGSRQAGSAILGLFFGVLFLAGCYRLGERLFTHIMPEWRAYHQYVETTALCTGSDLVALQGVEHDEVRPLVRLQYQYKGRRYDSWAYDASGYRTYKYEDAKAIVDGFHVNEFYPAWIDPRDPARAVVVRNFPYREMLLLLLPISFMFLCGAGLVYVVLSWDRSVERRAVRAASAARAVPGRNGERLETPFVPDARHLMNSPGVELAYRLPHDAPPWKLLALVLACLAAAGVTMVFAVIAAERITVGDTDWALLAFLTPLAAGAGWLVFRLVRKLYLLAGAGATVVEVSAAPLAPGRACDVLVIQTAAAPIEHLELLLVCEEEATFRQGTNTRTTRRRVFQSTVAALDPEAERRKRGELRAPLQVPAGAMHSFRAAHNQVSWRLIVLARAAGWPGIERSFPVVVAPPAAGSR